MMKKPLGVITHVTAALCGALLMRSTMPYLTTVSSPTPVALHEVEESQNVGAAKYSDESPDPAIGQSVPDNRSSITNNSIPLSFEQSTKEKLIALGLSNPEAAISWLFAKEVTSIRFALAYPFERREVVRQIFLSLSSEKVISALALLKEYDDAGLTSQALVGAMERIPAIIHPDEVVANLSKFTSVESSEKLIRDATLATWALSDPESARKWTLQTQNGDDRHSAIVVVAEAQLVSNPDSALAWAYDNVDPSLRSSALEYLIDVWSSSDPGSASRWLNEHLRFPDIDSSIRVFALKFYNVDPDNAQRWAMNIQDAGMRSEVIRTMQADGK